MFRDVDHRRVRRTASDAWLVFCKEQGHARGRTVSRRVDPLGVNLRQFFRGDLDIGDQQQGVGGVPEAAQVVNPARSCSDNFTDKQYHEHLDLRTGHGVFQPGINFYFGVELTY